jgi:hypothetical protein
MYDILKRARIPKRALTDNIHICRISEGHVSVRSVPHTVKMWGGEKIRRCVGCFSICTSINLLQLVRIECLLSRLPLHHVLYLVLSGTQGNDTDPLTPLWYSASKALRHSIIWVRINCGASGTDWQSVDLTLKTYLTDSESRHLRKTRICVFFFKMSNLCSALLLHSCIRLINQQKKFWVTFVLSSSLLISTMATLTRTARIWSRSRTNFAYSPARGAPSAYPFQQHRVMSSFEDENKEPKKLRSKPFLLDLGIPSLIPEWKKMFDSKTILSDVSAGLTVGCIAVPLSLAIAMASGVPAEVGLATAAVSGIAGGLMGGTTLAVTGPAAAISLLVIGAVQAHGLESLPFITVAVGGLQMASGVTRLGIYAKLVPVSVIAGFTTGVGTLILSGQIPKALGMAAPPGLNPLEMAGWLGSNIGGACPESAALAFGTAGAMYLLPKVHPKIPGALIAVGGATAATHMFGLDVALIGTLPSGLEAFKCAMPVMPPMEAIPSLATSIFLIYFMTTVESLLSCVALEKMKKTSYKHNPDQELVVSTLYSCRCAS